MTQVTITWVTITWVEALQRLGNILGILQCLESGQLVLYCHQLYLYIIVQEEEVRPEASVTSELSSEMSQHEVSDAEMQLIEQEKMLIHLKDVIRDCEKSLATKDAELEVRNLCSG